MKKTLREHIDDNIISTLNYQKIARPTRQNKEI